jgi:hypothetical protein
MPYGTVNADVIGTSVANTSLGAGNASIMKNRIINGAMVIDQRNAGASVTPANGDYTLDRWKTGNSQSSKYTVQQNAGSVTPPVGFSKYLGVTSSSAYAVTSTDYFLQYQAIEGFNFADLGWGTASAKTITISFQVYSSLTGTFGGTLLNSAADRCYVFSYSISVANTWTTVSVTIAGDTTGTWVGATNGVGCYVFFSLGAGSSVSGTSGSWGSTLYRSVTGATSVVGTNGATFYITGVQLEVGTSATGYEYRQYQQELALCQRYYSTLGRQLIGNIFSGSGGRLTGALPVQMRSAPTLTLGNTGLITPGVASYTISSLSTQNTTNNGVQCDCNFTGGTAPNVVMGSADAIFLASAEL